MFPYISACLHTELAHWLCLSGQHLSPSRQLTHVPAIVAYSTSTQPLHLSLPLHLYFSTPQEAVLTAGAKYIRQYEWIQLYCLSYNTLIFCPWKHKRCICRCDTRSDQWPRALRRYHSDSGSPGIKLRLGQLRFLTATRREFEW